LSAMNGVVDTDEICCIVAASLRLRVSSRRCRGSQIAPLAAAAACRYHAAMGASNSTVRERFQAVMNFEPVDELPAMEWICWWDKTIERWLGEGLPKGLGREDLLRHFGLDVNEWLWLHPRRQIQRPKSRPRGLGCIDTEAQYEQVVAPALAQPVVDLARLEQIAAAQTRGEVVVWLQIDGFFWFPREVLGIEAHLYAFFDRPKLLHRINEDLCRYNLALLEKVLAVLTPDVLTFAEDLSYNHGPMLSRPQFDEFVARYYRQIVPLVKRHGTIPMVDTDGNVTPVIPWFEDAGIEGCLPLERMAGVDVAELRRRHPRWRMIGGFDKMLTHRGEQAIRAELDRLLPVMRSGGFIPSTDHQTPPDVSMETFGTYVRILREYCRQARQAEACKP